MNTVDTPETTKPPTNMANQQIVNQKKPNESLKLSNSTRNRLAASLDRLNTVLKSGKPISDAAKQSLGRSIDQLIQALVELPPVDSPANIINDSVVVDRIMAGRITFTMPKAERSAMIIHLVNVKDAVIFNDSVTLNSLIAENKKIFDGFLELPYEICASEEDEPYERGRRHFV